MRTEGLNEVINWRKEGYIKRGKRVNSYKSTTKESRVFVRFYRGEKTG